MISSILLLALPFVSSPHQLVINRNEPAFLSTANHHTNSSADNNERTNLTPPRRAPVPIANGHDQILPSNDVRSFTCYQQNVRGLRTKTNSLMLALSQCEYDVIALTETWLNNDILDSELTHNYTIHRCDRNARTSRHKRGGGVLIAVRNELRSAAVHIADSDELEQIVVRVLLPNFELFVCCIYLPPNSNPLLYTQHAECVQKLTKLVGDRNVILVVGDYNLPHLCWTQDENLKCMLPINASTEQKLPWSSPSCRMGCIK